MRIDLVSVQVSPFAEPGDPGWSAQAVQVGELADALAGAGHEVTVLARRDDPSRPSTVSPRPGLTVRHLDAGPPSPLPGERLVAAVPELARQLDEHWRADRPDVVHAHHWTSGLAAGAAAHAIPRVQTFHGLSRPGSGPAGRAPAEQAVARSADRVVALSEDELSALLQRGAPRARLRVVPAGIDTEIWRPDGPSLRRADRPRIVSLGSVAPGGGTDEVIQALRAVPDAELFVAGGPAPERAADDPDLARLHAAAARNGVAKRVRFLGAVSRADVPRLLRSADVLASTPPRESSGTAALEAMACGRAVVATAVGGLRDTVVDQVTGVHVLPGRPSELAAALREVIGDAGTVTAFGIAGRDRASSRYARSRIVEAMTEVYREAISTTVVSTTPVSTAVVDDGEDTVAASV
ncbi:glycosyltransferase involved in cell wall biosynthesis [Pseudonocardia sediminis]|uniref:Glycosyltransferase involved in cell wall biosynthesis n=1 Tax=Pseudonocardia sediminis TaxID=1397368 RepID=A0A4Q7V1E2_PSEST|nr:glycosyltransferase [Pseudonocardia sediminis]RZT87248.1 glycosyltransferase involved in cell wall biosynthesis [Pseudonocardia sediminis]